MHASKAAGMRVLGFAGGSHCAPGYDAMLREAGAAEVFADMARSAARCSKCARTSIAMISRASLVPSAESVRTPRWFQAVVGELLRSAPSRCRDGF